MFQLGLGQPLILENRRVPKNPPRYTCANDLSTRDWQKVPELSGSGDPTRFEKFGSQKSRVSRVQRRWSFLVPFFLEIFL